MRHDLIGWYGRLPPGIRAHERAEAKRRMRLHRAAHPCHRGSPPQGHPVYDEAACLRFAAEAIGMNLPVLADFWTHRAAKRQPSATLDVGRYNPNILEDIFDYLLACPMPALILFRRGV